MSEPPSRSARLPCVLGMLLALLVLIGNLAPPAQAESVRAQQWYLDVWKIDEVWKLARGAGVTVAVIDGGVDATHPDLVGQVQSSLNSPGDSDGHGTGMASLIAGQGQAGGGQGVYGVAPEAKILPFRSARTPSGKMDPISTAKGIRLAADSSARIINLSIGGSAGNPVEREAISYALSKGKLVVAAGGNSPEDVNDQPVYPASYPGVLAISALSREGKPASNSIRGPWISLSAPGEEIPHACTTSTRYCKGVGSSDATALTSGVAALVWSVHPDWTANQVIRRLIDTANRPNEPVPSDTFGYGAVSPRKALAATDTPGPADVNPLIGVRGDKPAPATTAPSTSPSAAASAPAAPAGTAPPAATADKSGDDDNLLVPILVGTIAAAALVAGATVITMRRRRARELARRQAAAAPPWPTAPPTYHPGGGPYDRR